jgi:hypothetical protein
MSKRHRDALAIWQGACNPTAVANSIVGACQEIREGTDARCNDPAVRLMVYQLAYLCGVITGAERMTRDPDIFECVNQCEVDIGT